MKTKKKAKIFDRIVRITKEWEKRQGYQLIDDPASSDNILEHIERTLYEFDIASKKLDKMELVLYEQD